MTTTVPNRELLGQDISVHLSPQTTKGTVDATPQFFKVKRIGGMIKQNKTSTTSNTISNSQNGKQNIQTGSEQAAEISTEVFNQTKTLLNAAIHAPELDRTYTGTDVAITATGFTIPGTTLVAGDFIFVSGATDELNNVTYCVTDVTGDEVTTNPAPAATEVAGASITVSCKKYVNGVTPTYFLGQRRQLDKSKVGELAYFNFTDGLIDSMSIEIPEEDLLTATTNMIWEVAEDGRAAIAGQTDATEDASQAASVKNQFKGFWIDYEKPNCLLKSGSIEIANGYQGSPSAGCKRVELGGREFAVNGSFVAKNYIANSTYWEEKFLAGDRINLAFEIVWPDGNAMVIQIERAYLAEHEQGSETGFSNSTLNFQAEENSDTNSTIRVFTNF
jgi:hypothetical protein